MVKFVVKSRENEVSKTRSGNNRQEEKGGEKSESESSRRKEKRTRQKRRKMIAKHYYIAYKVDQLKCTICDCVKHYGGLIIYSKADLRFKRNPL